jgi:TPP-dependent pyruvate/acetoin dehydrogenase alpha subunit
MLSEALRQTRDEEIQEIAEEAYRGATELLTDHRDLLDEIAERLLRQEVIEREEIQEIMNAHRDSGERPAEIHEPAPGSPAEALVSKPPREPGTEPK